MEGATITFPIAATTHRAHLDQPRRASRNRVTYPLFAPVEVVKDLKQPFILPDLEDELMLLYNLPAMLARAEQVRRDAAKKREENPLYNTEEQRRDTARLAPALLEEEAALGAFYRQLPAMRETFKRCTLCDVEHHVSEERCRVDHKSRQCGCCSERHHHPRFVSNTYRGCRDNVYLPTSMGYHVVGVMCGRCKRMVWRIPRSDVFDCRRCGTVVWFNGRIFAMHDPQLYKSPVKPALERPSKVARTSLHADVPQAMASGPATELERLTMEYHDLTLRLQPLEATLDELHMRFENGGDWSVTDAQHMSDLHELLMPDWTVLRYYNEELARLEASEELPGELTLAEAEDVINDCGKRLLMRGPAAEAPLDDVTKKLQELRVRDRALPVESETMKFVENGFRGVTICVLTRAHQHAKQWDCAPRGTVVHVTNRRGQQGFAVTNLSGEDIVVCWIKREEQVVPQYFEDMDECLIVETGDTRDTIDVPKTPSVSSSGLPVECCDLIFWRHESADVWHCVKMPYRVVE